MGNSLACTEAIRSRFTLVLPCLAAHSSSSWGRYSYHADPFTNTGKYTQILAVGYLQLSLVVSQLTGPPDVCQPALSIQIIWMSLALNASTDLYLMSIPVPMLWKSGLKLSRKIASTILLTSGVFIVVCALLRSLLITIVSRTRARRTDIFLIRTTCDIYHTILFC